MTPEEQAEDLRWKAYNDDLRQRNLPRRMAMGELPVGSYVIRLLVPVIVIAWFLSLIYRHGMEAGRDIAEAQHHAQVEYLTQALQHCGEPVVGNNGN